MSLTDDDKLWFGEQFEKFEGQIEAKIDQRIQASEDRMTEVMRDMQSELLRGFAAFAETYAIWLNNLR